MKMLKKDVPFSQIATIAVLLIASGCASTTSTATGNSAAAPVAKTPTAIAPTPTPTAAASAPPSGSASASTSAAASATMLTGAQEVPPNSSSASGKSTIMVSPDRMITGAIDVSGMKATMAHIHEASKGVNGPVIVPFVKSGENTFTPAPGAKLTDAQYTSYLAGKLYLNVHSSAYPGGEVRLQLAPAK